MLWQNLCEKCKIDIYLEFSASIKWRNKIIFFILLSNIWNTYVVDQSISRWTDEQVVLLLSWCFKKFFEKNHIFLFSQFFVVYTSKMFYRWYKYLHKTFFQVYLYHTGEEKVLLFFSFGPGSKHTGLSIYKELLRNIL